MNSPHEGTYDPGYTATYGNAFENVANEVSHAKGYRSTLTGRRQLAAALARAHPPLQGIKLHHPELDTLSFGPGYRIGEYSEGQDETGTIKQWHLEWAMLERQPTELHDILRLCEMEGGQHRDYRPTGMYIAREIATKLLIPLIVTPTTTRLDDRLYDASLPERKTADNLFSRLERASDRLTKERLTVAFTTVSRRANLGNRTYTPPHPVQTNNAFSRSEDSRLCDVRLTTDQSGNYYSLPHQGEYGQLLAYPGPSDIQGNEIYWPIWARFRQPPFEPHSSHEVLQLAFSYIDNNTDSRIIPGPRGLYIVRHFESDTILPVVATDNEPAMLADESTAAFLLEQLHLAAAYTPPKTTRRTRSIEALWGDGNSTQLL